jgi:hypothetical protein
MADAHLRALPLDPSPRDRAQIQRFPLHSLVERLFLNLVKMLWLFGRNG